MTNVVKTTKRFAFSLLTSAALFSSLTITSCQDYEFDFTEAEIHEAAMLRKFNNDFVEHFGEIAPNHQWGFDLASAAMGLDNVSLTRSVIKQEQNLPNTDIPITTIYSIPSDISQREHDEVYAWFTNHKVEWVTTPTYYDGVPTRQIVNNIAVVQNTDYAAAGYGSLAWEQYKGFNVLGDYTPAIYFNFHNGWVQSVASNNNYEIVKHATKDHKQIYVDRSTNNMYFESSESVYTRIDNRSEIVYDNGSPVYYDGDPKFLVEYTTTIDKSSKMNYLYSWGLTADGSGMWQEHLNDFNKGIGYGWEKQPLNDKNDCHGQNAILITDADINTWTYDSSEGSSLKHDKYFLVYLKGEGYEGYYLGFDFESWGDENNERIFADGICNDWIIKIGDAGVNQYNPARVMCEDLAMVNCDYDYNDIVYDVQLELKEGKQFVTITVQAAGGTVPISIWYDNDQLKKNDKNGVYTHEIHTLFDAPIKTPINVKGPGVDRDPVVFHLLFSADGSETYQDPSNNYTWTSFDFYGVAKFDMQKIKVKVQHETDAEWVNIDNIRGDAPVRFCVPNTVKWTKENQDIEVAYPGFRNWVINPTNLFWASGKPINEGMLYNRY